MKNTILGYALIVFAILFPLLAYVLYCLLMLCSVFKSSPNGAEGACVMIGIIGTIMILIGGLHRLSK